MPATAASRSRSKSLSRAPPVVPQPTVELDQPLPGVCVDDTGDADLAANAPGRARSVRALGQRAGIRARGPSRSRPQRPQHATRKSRRGASLRASIAATMRRAVVCLLCTARETATDGRRSRRVSSSATSSGRLVVAHARRPEVPQDTVVACRRSCTTRTARRATTGASWDGDRDRSVLGPRLAPARRCAHGDTREAAPSREPDARTGCRTRRHQPSPLQPTSPTPVWSMNTPANDGARSRRRTDGDVVGLEADADDLDATRRRREASRSAVRLGCATVGVATSPATRTGPSCGRRIVDT